MGIINCKKIAAEMKDEMILEVQEMIKTCSKVPNLAIIQVGDNTSSNSYVRGILKSCSEVGIAGTLYKLEEISTDTAQMRNLISNLNQDISVNGIIIQLPLPSFIDKDSVVQAISPLKDVDGLNASSIFSPCTALAILKVVKLLCFENEIQGKNVVVVGRSRLVGKPIANMLLDENATVTLCHSYTKNLSSHTRNADVLVVATGRRGLITKEMVKKNAIVIDVGSTRDNKGDFYGDVTPDVAEIAQATSVTNGIGLITRIELLANTILASKIGGTTTE